MKQANWREIKKLGLDRKVGLVVPTPEEIVEYSGALVTGCPVCDPPHPATETCPVASPEARSGWKWS